MAERRQLLTPQFVIQTLIMVAMSGGSAFFAYGTKTAVLERTVDRVEVLVSDIVKQQATLIATVNKSNIDSARETTRLQADLAAASKELTEFKAAVQRKDDELANAIRLQDLQMINFGKSIATIQGELNAERRKRE